MRAAVVLGHKHSVSELAVAATESSSSDAGAAVLVVDLDGTLVKTDLLLESFLVLFKTRPWMVFMLPLWLLGGKAKLKAEIAARADVPADALVYDEALLGRLRNERATGRRLVLATASDVKYATAVASHVGLFDDVLASHGERNLRGERKLAAIIEYTGGAAFDYAGNEAIDLPIWRKARKVICVDTPTGVVRTVKTFTEPEELRSKRRAYPKLVIKAIRVHQWLKNALVFVPLLAVHRVADTHLDVQVVGAFFAFGLCASSVYILNDLMDLRADRVHPRKRLRPFASGELPITHGFVLIPLLLGGSLAISLTLLPPIFLGALAVYYASTLAYTFVVKQLVVWDVVLLAGLYVMRILAGAAAVPVPPSFWLLAFSMFIFTSLALAKRFSEMDTVQRLGKKESTGRGYQTADIPLLLAMGVAAGYIAVLVMALYINSPEVHALYRRPYALWAICPLLLLWISRIWLKTHRGQMHDDPVVFAAKDALSLVVGALCGACVVVGAW